MKPASQTLIDLLLTNDFEDTDLYTVALANGGVLRYAALDVDVVWNGHTFSSKPMIERQDNRPTGHWKSGVDTDSWQVHFIPRDVDVVTGAELPDVLSGQPWMTAVKGGALDGATVLVERAFFGAWPVPWTRTVTPVGTIVIFSGRVAEVDFTRISAIVTVNSWMELLTQDMPRNLYQSGCRFTLFGPGCSLLAASFAVNGSAASGSSPSAINASLGQAAGYFDLGRLKMTSGLNATFSRGVKSWDGTTLKLRAPFPFAVGVGDAFTVYPGCDKTIATCTNKFNNLANFGGFPYIPAPENAV
jgi:uncharacterized phage protein (TIGR02218 family)